jgi:predicted N-acetyltransferase YhbS
MRKARSNAARSLPQQRVIHLPHGYQLQPGSTADHPAVEELLVEVFAGHAREAFRAALEDPSYEPNDRLLIQCDDKTIGHVLLSPRYLICGPGTLPATHVSWLATLPEYRQQGLATLLLAAAREHMVARRSVIATAWCPQPGYLANRGWTPWLHRRFRYDDPRLVVSRMGEIDAGELSVRYWRRSEAAALVGLHQGRARQSWGALVRSEAMWQWNTSHDRFDRIYVAVNGPERRRGGPEFEPLLGYLIVRGDAIVEHAWEVGQEHVARVLLSRVCHDAIERNALRLGILEQPGDPLVPYFAANSQPSGPQANGSTLMATVLDVPGLLRALTPILQQTARDAGLLPCQLGVDVAGVRGCWALERRRARFVEGRSRTYLALEPSEMLHLALGIGSAVERLEQKQIRASNRTAARLAEALFPSRPAWISPLDDLMY